MSTPKGIFCIEGQWNTSPRSKQSIRPILELLHTSCGIKHIYHKCNTKAEFFEALRKFTFRRYDRYSILYIAFHGKPNGICIGNEFITLDEISNVFSGCLKDFVIHFGSCSTLRVKQLVIDGFLTKTGASMISGYRKQVDFVESTAEEMVWFNKLSNTHQINKLKSCYKTNNGYICTVSQTKIICY